MALTINLGLVANAGGTADVITATFVPAPASLYQNLKVWLKVASDNLTSTPTLNVNGLGARTITKKGGSALAASDLKANGYASLCYDLANTRWELINPASDADTTPTLAQVLATGALTGETSITSNDGNTVVGILNGNLIMQVSAGTDLGTISTDGTLSIMSYAGASESGDFIVNAVRAYIGHSLLTEINSPNIKLTQETASRFVTTDASKNIDTVKTIPTGDVVGTSDSQALTNKTIDGDLNTVQDLAYTVLKTVVGNAGNVIKYNDSTGAPELQLYQGFSLTAFHTTLAPADATTYYWGSDFVLAPTTSAAILRIYPPKACTLKAVFLKTRCTVGSNEAVGISVIKNNTTTTSIGSIDLSNSQTNNLFTGLSITFNGTTDYLEMVYDPTTWVTNPTNLRAYAALYFE